MNGLGGIVKKAPNALIWAVVICFVAILGALVLLQLNGADTSELWAFVNRLTNIATTILSGSGLIVAGAAYRSASNAERQTNGELDAKVEKAVHRAIYKAPDGK